MVLLDGLIKTTFLIVFQTNIEQLLTHSQQYKLL